jgi:hypothetical protein
MFSGKKLKEDWSDVVAARGLSVKNSAFIQRTESSITSPFS